MTKITKSIYQFKKLSDKRESCLSITVDYDPEYDTVDGIIEVTCYNCEKNVTTDITAIMAEQFSNELDKMIDSINWRQEYADQMAERRIAV